MERLTIRIPKKEEPIECTHEEPVRKSSHSRKVTFGTSVFIVSPRKKHCEVCFLTPQACKSLLQERGSRSV